MREYELQVYKFEESSSDCGLVEHWQSSNTLRSEKMRLSCFRVLSGSSEAIVRWMEK